MVQYCDDYEWCRKAIQDAIDPLKELESYQEFEQNFHNLMYQMLFSDDQFEMAEGNLYVK